VVLQDAVQVCRLPLEVGVERAHDDARVPGPFPVQEYEVPAVQRQKDPAFPGGEGKHLLVGHGSSGLAHLLRREHIVAHPSQRLDDG
jgi:hypothetical protein